MPVTKYLLAKTYRSFFIVDLQLIMKRKFFAPTLQNLSFTKFNFSIWKNSAFTQNFFNTQQLVVFCNPVCATCRTGFYLTTIECNSKVCNGCIFCFATAMTHDRIIAVFLRQGDCINRFCQRSDLIHFYQKAVGNLLVNSFLKPFYICNKQIVTYQLNLISYFFGKQFPAFPIIFGHTIFK